MTYWANKQYLIYNVHGRLNGPAGPWGSIYYDENIFAMLLLATMPFVFYLALIAKNKVIKYALFFVLPFGWHAVFLTGSRGGLITLFIVSILISFRSLKGSYILGFLLMLMIAFAWQGGSIMKQRAGTIDNYSEDESAMGRIDAWSAAIEMAKAHPFTGVGFAAFGQAFSSFSNERPRVAHNTFFQLLGENGLLGACSFLGIILYPICKLFALAKRIKRTNIMADRTLLFSIEAILASLISFGVSAIFLSLDQYDIFYVLIVMANFIILYGNNRIFSGGK
jgi:probable O-glycosylation ligase (exosortase A-associated)